MKPIFTAFTGSDLDGLSVEIDPAKTGVSYYKAVERTDIKNLGTRPTTSSTGRPRLRHQGIDLKGVGTYMALVTVPADDAHFTGERYSEVFRIAKDAGFADVDASAWYASVVYKAKELGYVNGLAGTDLFAPGANITRGDVACILFNMAGATTSWETSSTPKARAGSPGSTTWTATPTTPRPSPGQRRPV